MGDVIDYYDYIDNKTDLTRDIPNINFSYISNDDFKYFIKESLMDIFINKNTQLEKQHQELMEERFRPCWLKPFEKIVINRFTNERYVIKNNEIAIYDKENNMRGKEPIINRRIRKIFRNHGYEVFMINEFRTSKTCNVCGSCCNTF